MSEAYLKYISEISSTPKAQHNSASKAVSASRGVDVALENLWKIFLAIPVNPENNCIERNLLGFPPGTPREKVINWFDKRYSKGVSGLIENMKEGDAKTDALER